jgi:hypothetical protein
LQFTSTISKQASLTNAVIRIDTRGIVSELKQTVGITALRNNRAGWSQRRQSRHGCEKGSTLKEFHFKI